MAEFNDLSAELVEMVAEFATDRDLLSLRLVSKRLAAMVSRPFIRTYFTERSFLLLNKHSMQTLHAIAADEVFGTTMKTIKLSPVLPLSNEDDFKRRLEALPGASRSLRDKRRTCFKQYETMVEEVDLCATSVQLAAALRHFYKVGKVPSIESTSAYLEEDRKPWGYHLVSRSVGYDEPLKVASCGRATRSIFTMILWAIQDARVPIRTLRLGCRNLSVPIQCFNPTAGYLPFASALAFESLTTLELSLSTSTLEVDRDCKLLLHPDGLSNLLLTRTVNLERLVFTFDSPTPIYHNCSFFRTIASGRGTGYFSERSIFDSISWMSRDRALMKLKSLELRGTILRFDNLLRFVRVRCNTLNEIKLQNVQFYTEKHSHAEQMIREHLQAYRTVDVQDPVVSVSDSWDGWRWIEAWLERPAPENAVFQTLGPGSLYVQAIDKTRDDFLLESYLHHHWDPAMFIPEHGRIHACGLSTL